MAEAPTTNNPNAAAPAPPAAPKPDPFLSRILSDMHKAVGQDGAVIEAVPDPAALKEPVIDSGFVSMGEAARWKQERAEAGKTDEQKKAEADAKASEEAKKAAADPAAAPAKTEEKPAGDKPASDPAAAPAAPAAKKPVEVVKAKPIEEIVEG